METGLEYGLIGAKLGHSFSPEIHAKIGHYPYELRELSPDGVHQLLEERTFRGLNVTIPYKELVIPLLDEISDRARKIGAVNTIVNRNGRLYGDNTDYSGAAALIRHAGVEISGRKVLILGTGGTSKTLRAVTEAMGARKIVRVSRHSGEGLCTYEEAARLHSDAQVIVNTTPVGMFPNVDGCPLEVEQFPALEGVVDVVYNPLSTRLVQSARKLGLPAEGGLYMLCAQAVYAAGRFFDREIDDSRIEGIYRSVLREKQNVVLIGMPSCGKTTVGRWVARRLKRPFRDTDKLIVRRAGKSIPEIFAEKGETGFRQMEAEIVAEVARESGVVIATGGGSALNPESVRRLKQNGLICFLDRPLEKLRPTGDRPLSSSTDALKKRFEERYPLYNAVCDRRLPADGTIEENVELVLEAAGFGRKAGDGPWKNFCAAFQELRPPAADRCIAGGRGKPYGRCSYESGYSGDHGLRSGAGSGNPSGKRTFVGEGLRRTSSSERFTAGASLPGKRKHFAVSDPDGAVRRGRRFPRRGTSDGPRRKRLRGAAEGTRCDVRR